MTNETNYFKNCPGCSKTQTYNNKHNLNRAVKSNTICHSCRMKQRVYSDETRQKMSASAKLRNPNFLGKHHSEESKQKISKNQPDKSGKNNPFFGKTFKHSSETKKILSIIGKKRFENPAMREKMSIIGKTRFENPVIKKRMSEITKKRFENPNNLKKMANAVKLAMHRPDIRKKHLESLAATKWLGKAVDKGQLKLLEKWNKLGFQFETNYQLYRDGFLCYLDGYDKIHNVILEYDSKYHRKLNQKQKDLVRQQKIIKILNPKKFWRYDAVNKTIKNVLEGGQNAV